MDPGEGGEGRENIHLAPWTRPTRPLLASDERHLLVIPERMDAICAMRGVGTTS